MTGRRVIVTTGLILAAAGLLTRERVSEQVKGLSDVVVGTVLRTTSQFGRELTEERRAEQDLFRRQRLRDLR